MLRPAGLCVALGLLLSGACPDRSGSAEPSGPGAKLVTSGDEVADVGAMCRTGCRKLVACIPELASAADGDPERLSSRIATDCESACAEFEDRPAAGTLGDCLSLSDCPSFHACATSVSVAPWLAAVAPAVSRDCETLCDRASACAADRCEGTECESTVERRIGELDESCLLRCRETDSGSRARDELLACSDYGACDGLLGCLDGWAEAVYEQAAPGEVPGIGPLCDEYCSRAIRCGAAEEELDESELTRLRESMTEAWVECGVDCERKHAVEGPGDLRACVDAGTCDLFLKCMEPDD